MSRPIRMFEPDGLQFITNRTLEAMFLMTPIPVLREIIGSTLARAARLYEITLYDYAFLSSHFHLLLSGAPAHIPLFMQYLQSVLARRINRVLNRHGAFFERRYSAESVEDDEAAIARFRYILAHSVKENLVRLCTEWPGIHAVQQLLTGEPETFEWHTNPAGPQPTDATTVAVETLVVSPLPCWQDMPSMDRQRMIGGIVAEIETEAAETHAGKPPLGVEAILAQSPFARTVHPTRSCRPLCHASTKAGYDAYRERYRDFCTVYCTASDLYRRGNWDAPFPDYSFRPPVIVDRTELEHLHERVAPPGYRRCPGHASVRPRSSVPFGAAQGAASAAS